MMKLRTCNSTTRRNNLAIERVQPRSFILLHYKRLQRNSIVNVIYQCALYAPARGRYKPLPPGVGTGPNCCNMLN